MNKNELRKFFRLKRKQYTPHQLHEQGIAVANHLLRLPIWFKETFHLFMSIERLHEMDTQPILQLLMGRDKNIAVSRSDFKQKTMDAVLLTDQTRFKLNPYGIPEPLNGVPINPRYIDVIIVPMLICDAVGNRLGYGGGFYDRFLSSCSPQCIKIGISSFEPIDTLPIEPWDVRLDYCVTPQGVHNFNGG